MLSVTGNGLGIDKQQNMSENDAPSTPLRIYTNWHDENKENIDPRWGNKENDPKGKRALKTRKPSKLSPTKLQQKGALLTLLDSTNIVSGVDREEGSPRSILDLEKPRVPRRSKVVTPSFDIYDENLPVAARC